MDLSKIHLILQPENYFESRESRMSLRTYGQIYKDAHDILAQQMTNVELVARSPYILSSLVKKGTRLSLETIKRSLNGYFNRMSASSEFNFVVDDLSHLILNYQRIQDNSKLVASGGFSI